MTTSTEIPHLSPWEPPATTTSLQDEDYITLEAIDISLFPLTADSNLQGGPLSSEANQARLDIASRAVQALGETGYIVVKGHGLSHDELQKQFDLGKLLIDEPVDEEKRKLAAKINEEQSWAGYKPTGFHRRTGGAWDALEHYDFYPFTARTSCLPDAAKPHVDEFRKFIEFNHYTLLRKILAMISIGLGLEEDTLWKLHHIGDPNERPWQRAQDQDEEIHWPHSKDHLRYAMYYPPREEEDRVKTNYLWMIPHTDRGSVTFLYSQPITGLQVQVGDEWKWVRYYPDQIVVNTGDCLNILTGGIIKAPPHRVHEPTEDQRQLGIFYFVPFLPDTPLEPIDDPALRALGAKDVFEEYRNLGGQPMTVKDWLRLRTKLIGTKREKREKRTAMDVLEDIHFAFTSQSAAPTAVTVEPMS